MREASFAPGSASLCSDIKCLLVMSWITINAVGSKANLRTGLSPAFGTLCQQTVRSTRTCDTYRNLRHTAQSPSTAWTDRQSCHFFKSIITSVGSSCSGCTWSAQQRLRQSRRWALAESVHGSPGECGNTFQPQDHNVATVDGNVDLSHHPHADKTERREDVTATTLPQDETKRSGSSETIGRNFECLTELEPLVQQVAVALEERCGVHGGDQILVLVSGGSDSVALLVALLSAAPFFQPHLRVEAVHFNHALRGEDSQADETFVSNLAQSLGIKLHVRRWKGADEGGTGGAGSGMQERARKWRQSEARNILQGTLSQSKVGSACGDGRGDGNSGFIATAHHRDDQAETILLKALRGAHITKMQGMAWVAGPFIRPLLEARKSDIVDFLQQTGQGWREDASNQVAKYTRNRVRLQLMPLLQDLAGCVGALDTRLDELSRQSKLAREMVQSQAEYWEHQHCVSANPGLDNGEQSESRRQESGFPAERRLDLFPLLPFLRVRGNKGDAGDGCRERPLPELVREELLHRFVTANTRGAVLPYAQLQILMRQVDGGGNKWSLSLGGGLTLRRLGDFLQVQPNDDVRESSSRVDVAGSSSLQLSLSEAAAAGSPHDGGEGGDGTGKRERGMVLYNVSPGTKLHVRRRRDGDRFRPKWRDRPTRLKDFLRGQGVPLHRRDEVALICDQKDDIVAVYPYFAGAEFNEDTTGTVPIRVRLEGAPIWCPHPGRDVQGGREHDFGGYVNEDGSCM